MNRKARKVLWSLVLLTALIAFGGGYAAYRVMEPIEVSIDPRGAYLLTDPDDEAAEAVPLDLADVGLAPGDTIRIRRVGTFHGGRRETTQFAAVFSRDARLISSTERHRVPGAIDAGEDHVSSGTFWRKQRNDIPEDFNVNEAVTVTIPAGATHLFIAPPDSLFDDNEDPDGDFGARITKLPASWWPGFLARR